MASGDLYEAKVYCTSSTNEALCIFHYLQSGVGSNQSAAVITRIRAQWLTVFAAAMHTDADITRIDVRNVFDPTDFASTLFTIGEYPGVQGGTALPDFVAAALTCPRKRTDMRNGQKRIPFMAEGNSSQNLWNSTYLSYLNTVAGAISDPLLTTGATFYPVIVKRIKYTAPSGKPAYRLPTSPAELQAYQADSWEAVNLVSSQDTRKLFR